MIVSPQDGGLVIVLQVDHQVQCREMADAWGNDEFSRLPEWGSLVDAAAWHDEGWRAWEATPQVDAEGCPENFIAVDRRVHVEIYRRGIAHALELGDRTGLLVSLHGQGLYEARLGLDGPPPPRGRQIPEVRRFLAEQDLLQRRLGARGHPRETAWDAFRLLQAWDLLSLYMTWRGLPGGRDGTLASVPRGPGDPGVTVRLRPGGPRLVELDPYPFRVDPLELPVRAREVPDRPYSDAADLGRELASAPPVSLRIVVRAG